MTNQIFDKYHTIEYNGKLYTYYLGSPNFPNNPISLYGYYYYVLATNVENPDDQIQIKWYPTKLWLAASEIAPLQAALERVFKKLRLCQPISRDEEYYLNFYPQKVKKLFKFHDFPVGYDFLQVNLDDKSNACNWSYPDLIIEI